MKSIRWSWVVVAIALSIAACGDDGATGASTEGDTETPDDGTSTSSSGGTLSTSGASTSSTSTSSTGTTESSSTTSIDTSSTTSIDTTSTTSIDTTSTSSSTTADESSSSSTGPDIDLECEGPPGDDTCDEASPYDGFGDCDPYAQDCPAGEKCLPWANDGGNAWNATRCSPVDPAPVQLGEECTVVGSGVSGEDNCDVGLMCWSADVETNVGVCVELCGCGPVEPTCSGAGTFCVISNLGSLAICLSTCDPLVTDVCPPGDACYPVNGNFLCAPDASAGMGTQGEPCEFINVCAPGSSCVDDGTYPDCPGTGCCAQFCDLDTGGLDCPADTECTPFFAEGTEPEECHLDTGRCMPV